jgi:hypothetical protein
MGRNFLAHRQGNAMNAVLAAANYSFRRLIQWFRFILPPLAGPCRGPDALARTKKKKFADDSALSGVACAPPGQTALSDAYFMATSGQPPSLIGRKALSAGVVEISL